MLCSFVGNHRLALHQLAMRHILSRAEGIGKGEEHRASAVTASSLLPFTVLASLYVSSCGASPPFRQF